MLRNSHRRTRDVGRALDEKRTTNGCITNNETLFGYERCEVETSMGPAAMRIGSRRLSLTARVRSSRPLIGTAIRLLEAALQVLGFSFVEGLLVTYEEFDLVGVGDADLISG